MTSSFLVAVAVGPTPALAAIAATAPAAAVVVGVAGPAVGGTEGVCRGRWLGMVCAWIGGDAVAVLGLLFRRWGGTWSGAAAVLSTLRR